VIHSFTHFDDLACGLVARTTLVCDDHGGPNVAVLPEVHVGATVHV
jgi:hypothetical protein